jgi:uroporphyrinogen-III synthase
MTYTLLTRSKTDITQTTKDLASFMPDDQILSYPLIDIKPCRPNLSDSLKSANALIFTSRHAVRLFKDQIDVSHLAPMTIFCVGQQTADLCADIPHRDIHISTQGVDHLITLLHSVKDPMTALYLSGENIRRDLGAQQGHISIERHVLYRAELLDGLDERFFDLYEKNEISYALFYSVRTAQHFCNLLDRQCRENNVLLIENIICISSAVSDIFKKYRGVNVQTAKTHSHAAMMACLKEIN